MRWGPVFLVLVVVAGIATWRNNHRPAASALAESPPEAVVTQPEFECEGKRRCPEMVSCEEATYYLQSCPGVEIDGDGDGIPCEAQWCGNR